MIWLLLLIPAATVIILAILFTKRIAWWEYLLVFGVPVIAIVAGKTMSVESQIKDTEFWNTYVVQADYFEDWDEWDYETCYREVSCGTDSKGNTQYCTESYDCSHRDYYPAYWELTDNIGNTYRVSSGYFEKLCRLWNNKTFKDMHRDFYTDDGDNYYTVYDKAFDHTIPICFRMTYENRVQCSKSVFNFQEIDSTSKVTYKLFDYPPIPDKDIYNPILGYNDRSATEKLQRYNALNGSFKKLHMLLLVFENQPYEAGVLQESYWKGGNKNEFIVCVGKSSDKITWTKVISWSDVELLKVTVARKIREMNSFNADSIVTYMGTVIPKSFVKKDFRTFDYLTVEPTSAAIKITSIITILVCIGLAVFVVKNDINLRERDGKRIN